MSRILFADDDADMRAMVADVLRTAGHEVRLARGGTEALAEIRRDAPDLVILDYRMGAPDGFEVCRELKTTPRLEHLPVLILTAEGKTEERLQGFEAGADDYLPKPFDSRELLARVRALLRLSQQGLDRNPTSVLPGGEAIHREYQRRRRLGEPFALCYFDLDHFKPFGDRFGFSTGDEVIREAGRTLMEVSGADDFVGHVGGDDFLLMTRRERAIDAVLEAQREFRRGLANHVPAEVSRAGSYRGVDREGREREIPLTRLTAAIIYVDPARFSSLNEISERVAEAKLRAKSGKRGLAELDLAA